MYDTIFFAQSDLILPSSREWRGITSSSFYCLVVIGRRSCDVPRGGSAHSDSDLPVYLHRVCQPVLAPPLKCESLAALSLRTNRSSAGSSAETFAARKIPKSNSVRQARCFFLSVAGIQTQLWLGSSFNPGTGASMGNLAQRRQDFDWPGRTPTISKSPMARFPRRIAKFLSREARLTQRPRLDQRHARRTRAGDRNRSSTRPKKSCVGSVELAFEGDAHQPEIVQLCAESRRLGHHTGRSICATAIKTAGPRRLPFAPTVPRLQISKTHAPSD